MDIFSIFFQVIEKTENGIICGWRRALNSHKLHPGEQSMIQGVDISH